MSSRPQSWTINTPSINNSLLLLLRLFNFVEGHLGVELKPDDILELQTQLAIIVFLLPATLCLQLERN